MENIASPTPGTHTIAHCPGICSNSFPPRPEQLHRMFYIRCFLRDLCDHTNLRNQCIQCIIFMTGTFAHYCSPPMLLITLTIFKEGRAFLHTTSTSNAGIHAIIVCREINQLVHESLTETLHLVLYGCFRGAIIVKSEYMQESQQRYL